ncbi:thiamine biosynthesis lipoprotein [Paracoccus solventivorans]|uniref:FAD:protein FMN transferase n=2 Tax=Paracoccus solventivorans TaxID=53463 RepID=A0A1M7EXY5_9RHOB|nr:thiamine biosynthesis lipoprotein [Paracoccus solventivorans]
MRPMSTLIDRRRFLALGAACVAAPAVARGVSPLAGIGGAAFGTGWSVSLPAGTPTAALQAHIEALLADLDLVFSPWRADSVISRFNDAGAGDMAVADEVAEVAHSALIIAESSSGHFDPTVGPLVARWGFGPIDHGEAMPGGWRGLSVANDHIAKTRPGLTLDLCGIAKGHALDRMAGLLLDAGHDDFLIDFGGELAARGRHPSGRVWQVGIEDPRPEAEGFVGMLRLDSLAVATSGDRANGYNIGPRRYSHIIDPATREPVEGALASVSVLTASAREADGWATALMAAGEAGPELARNRDIAALFLFRDGVGLRSVATGAVEKHLA